MPEPQTCQICFDEPEPESSEDALLAQLCGPECEAKICRQCLTSHVRVSLERFYAGFVPSIRCPICLEPLSKCQWRFNLTGAGADQEDNAKKSHELVDRYETLCKQACGLTSPCCDKADYSHLPKAASNKTDGDSGEFSKAVGAIVPAAQSPSIALLWSMSLEFQAHQQTPQVVTKFLLQKFPNTDAKVLDELLTRIEDDERRATLLLSFLASRPLAFTRCCGHKFCFNCKRESHHSVCDNGQGVNLAANMIQCRNCRATLVKVEGCSAVTCLCGFYMNWDKELTHFKSLAKKLLSEDIYFNSELFAAWLKWKNQAPFLESALTSAHSAYRSRRLETCLVRYCCVLQPWIRRFLQRWRFRCIVMRIPAAWLGMQTKYYARKLTAPHQEQVAKLALLVANPSECLSIPTTPVANNRGSRLAERRDRAQRARMSSQKRRQKARGTVKKLLLYVRTNSPKAESSDASWNAGENSKSYTPTLVPATRKFVPKRARSWM